MEGRKMVEDVAVAFPDIVDFIVSTEPVPDSLALHDKVFISDAHDLDSISSLVSPQRIMAICCIPDSFFAPVIEEENFYIFCDGVQDPGNLGTIIRAADWFGTSGVLIGPGTVDPFGPKAVQAGMGSLFNLRISQYDYNALKRTPIPILAADMTGENAFHYNWPSRGILVMGNEGNGLSDAIQRLNPIKITVPAATGSSAESLNVAMACTSLLTLRSVKQSKVDYPQQANDM